MITLPAICFTYWRLPTGSTQHGTSRSVLPVSKFSFHVRTLRQVFLTFACQDLPEVGKRYLRADFRIECDTATHRAYQIYAAFMIVLCECTVITDAIAPYAHTNGYTHTILVVSKGEHRPLIPSLWLPLWDGQVRETMEQKRRSRARTTRESGGHRWKNGVARVQYREKPLVQCFRRESVVSR